MQHPIRNFRLATGDILSIKLRAEEPHGSGELVYVVKYINILKKGGEEYVQMLVFELRCTDGWLRRGSRVGICSVALISEQHFRE